MNTIKIDPVTRVSGLLGIEINVENNRVINAKVTGNQFRGMEKIFIGRFPFDLINLTPRVCGICSTHHALASTLALESALNIKPDENGKKIRDIANGFELLQNYIRHLYFMVIPDYVKIISINPLYKRESEGMDYRLNDKENEKINESYVEAIKYSREAHRALAMITGKAPHPHGIWIGGVTTKIDIANLEGLKYSLNNIKNFVVNRMINDVEIIAERYNEYYKLGSGHKNFMSFGLFADYQEANKYSTPGVILEGKKEVLDINNIFEDVTNSWLESNNTDKYPGVDNPLNPDLTKTTAYTWVEAPRYKGKSVEVGALARMTLSGKYNKGASVMDRLMAKAMEAEVVCDILGRLIDEIQLGEAVQKQWSIPNDCKGVGLVEAERGALGHWLSIKNKKVENFTLIAPSTWNLSPTDRNGVMGTVEEALVGIEINNLKTPVEIGRVIRSFDPCLNCAAHVVSDRFRPITINII